jgi:hypothetical protein
VTRTVIDMPLPLMRLTSVLWDIHWGGQGGGADLAGGDQTVISRFPRFIAEIDLRYERAAVGHWRALRAQMRGRSNALRVRMVDHATMDSVGLAIDPDINAFLSGNYTEPRPQVPCVAAASAGAASITIDERGAIAPVQVGAHLSYGDWPFLVVDRTGYGAAVTLQVELLRVSVPAGGLIDLIPRGVFLSDDPAQGAAAYGIHQRISPKMQLSEWITRT